MDCVPNWLHLAFVRDELTTTFTVAVIEVVRAFHRSVPLVELAGEGDRTLLIESCLDLESHVSIALLRA